MIYASFMIGFILSWAWIFPESFGRHLAEIAKAYRAALTEREGRE